jgi:hypothetical protein
LYIKIEHKNKKKEWKETKRRENELIILLLTLVRVISITFKIVNLINCRNFVSPILFFENFQVPTKVKKKVVEWIKVANYLFLTFNFAPCYEEFQEHFPAKTVDH